MIVTEDNFSKVMSELKKHDTLACDIETTGLMPYHGDELFAIIIATPRNSFYFNFKEYPSLSPLPQSVMEELKILFSNSDLTWLFHNPKAVDLPTLSQKQIEVRGRILDLQFLARIQNNTRQRLGLDYLAKEYGKSKLEGPLEYIKKHKLSSMKEIRGKRVRIKRFDLVPFDIISKYGEMDGRLTFDLYLKLSDSIRREDMMIPDPLPRQSQVVELETALIKALYSMERTGVRVNEDYCREAGSYYINRMDEIKAEFKEITGSDFIKSSKLFAELFADEKHKWAYTDKGNPVFDKGQIEKFDNPAAKLIIEYSKAKKQSEYFENFLFFADKDSIIHTDFKQAGTGTGRFSSSNPNLQNVTKPDKYDSIGKVDDSYTARRAFVPRDGFFFVMIDYQSMEYRMMLDMAGASGLIQKVKEGLDVHQATADIAGVTRTQAKTVNFASLYGSGIATLAKSLGTTPEEAKRIRDTIFRAAPEISNFIRRVIRTCESRSFIFNWMGRRSYFNKNYSYKGPNYLIQGGCADVVKKAMVLCDTYLKDYKSRMLLTIHDELIFEVAYGEEFVIQELKSIMESVYPYQQLPLTVDVEYSEKSLADKLEWDELAFESGKEGRNFTQGTSAKETSRASQFMGSEDSTSSITGNP